MMEDSKIEKKDCFTLRSKGIAAAVCGAAVLLWMVLWMIFPMPFYSLFFASNIGSNILLAILSVIITVPFNFIFSKMLSADIPLKISIAVNMVCMLAVVYTYSIFRYTAVYWVILAAAVHIILSAVIFIRSKPVHIPKIKTAASKFKLAAAGIICSVVSDCMYLLIFTFLLNIFRE